MKDKRIKLFVGAALMYIIGMILMMLFTLSCSKDDDTIGQPEAIFCNCTESTEVYDTVTGRTEQTNFRAFNGECNLSGREQSESDDGRFIITKTTQCTR